MPMSMSMRMPMPSTPIPVLFLSFPMATPKLVQTLTAIPASHLMWDLVANFVRVLVVGVLVGPVVGELLGTGVLVRIGQEFLGREGLLLEGRWVGIRVGGVGLLFFLPCF